MTRPPRPPRFPAPTHPTPLAGIRQALLLSALAAGLGGLPPAMAAETGGGGGAGPARFHTLPAAPLGEALAGFAASAGVSVQLDARLVEGRRAPALNGSYSVPAGFARLLAGSGLEVVERSPGTWVLRQAAIPAQGASTASPETVLPVVTVSAGMTQPHPGEPPRPYAGGQQARGGRLGLLGNVDTMDAPFAITAFTAQVVEDTQARTVADIARLDPSVRSSGMAADNSDSFFIRGFAIGDNNIGEIAFDGLYGAGPNYRLMADYAERIEVLKGPAAMIYGMSPNGAGGGTINVVPKRAEADLTRLRADYAGSRQLGGHIDVARRLGERREFGFRFNGTHQNGDTAIDQQSRTATLGALALDYQGERLRATLDLIDQREDIDAPSRRLWLNSGVAVPEAPDGRRNVTQPWEYSRSIEQSAMLRLEYQASEGVSLFASAARGESEVDRLFNTPSILNAAGDTSVRPSAGTFDIQRGTLEAGARVRFETGPVSHRTTLQASRYHDELGRGLVNGQVYTSNLHHPVAQPAQAIPLPGSVPRISATTLTGIALSHSMSMLDERLQFLLGVRRQEVDSRNYAADGNTVTASYDKDAVTPALGIVIKPRENVSLYANYIEGLAKGDTAPGTADNAGQIFSPYRSKQREVGVKIDHGRLMTGLSAFQITRPSGQLTNNIYGVDGEQRNRGIELTLYGEPVERVRLFGGITWIEAELTRTGNPATQGRTAVGIPRLQASLNAEWDVPLSAGLTLTGGLIHSGRQYVDQSNARQLPSWTTLDLGIRYRTDMAGRQVVWRARLDNSLDKHYWAGASTWSTLAVGAPRTLYLSATIDF